MTYPARLVSSRYTDVVTCLTVLCTPGDDRRSQGYRGRRRFEEQPMAGDVHPGGRVGQLDDPELLDYGCLEIPYPVVLATELAGQ